MKRTFLLLMVMLGVVSAYPADYPYLTFELSDGTKASVSVADLQLNISGTTLTAGEQTFQLANLSKMYFTTTDETVTGVTTVTTAVAEDIIKVYDLQGREVAREQMSHGIYVVKTKNGTYKLRVE